jgi:hypothetical protein
MNVTNQKQFRMILLRADSTERNFIEKREYKENFLRREK